MDYVLPPPLITLLFISKAFARKPMSVKTFIDSQFIQFWCKVGHTILTGGGMYYGGRIFFLTKCINKSTRFMQFCYNFCDNVPNSLWIEKNRCLKIFYNIFFIYFFFSSIDIQNQVFGLIMKIQFQIVFRILWNWMTKCKTRYSNWKERNLKILGKNQFFFSC